MMFEVIVRTENRCMSHPAGYILHIHTLMHVKSVTNSLYFNFICKQGIKGEKGSPGLKVE